MATLVARGFDDVLTEKMVTLSDAFVAEQVAIAPPDALRGFTAERNLLSAPSSEQLKLAPWVIWGVESQQDAQQGNSTQVRKETLTLVADLYVRKAADLGDADDEEAALTRLSYLKEQVKAILFSRANLHFGFAQGTIQKKTNFRYQQFSPSNEDSEAWIVGGRISLDCDFSWTPEDVTGTDIDSISVVNTGQWSLLYTY